MPAKTATSSPCRIGSVAAVLESRRTVSLVLACPSTDRQLNECSTASARISCRALAQRGASVSRNAEHRRHPRADHGRPLGDSQERHLPAGNGLALRDDLGASVGRHDRLRDGLKRLRADRKPGHGRGDPRLDLVHGELVADDAGRCDQRPARAGSPEGRRHARPCAGRWPGPGRRSRHWRCPS